MVTCQYSSDLRPRTQYHRAYNSFDYKSYNF